MPATVGPSLAATEAFTVVFSEAVNGVGIGDFALSTTGTASATMSSVSGSGAVYTVNLSGITGTGNLRLDLNSSGTGIVDGASNPIVGGYTSGGVRTVSAPAPASVPTMTEWAMILLGLMLAGVAALTIQRRRMAA